VSYPKVGKRLGLNNKGKKFSKLERWLLERGPIVLATQERYTVFQGIIQQQLHSNMRLASIPCGLMNDLLDLNYSGLDNIHLIGIDLDPVSLEMASKSSKASEHPIEPIFVQADAWNLSFREEFDLITSNGLNIYESSDSRVVELYMNFFKALRPGGLLVTSFLTPPPSLDSNSIWDMSKINMADLMLQKTIFSDILSAKWQTFRSPDLTRKQLSMVGFEDISFIYDRAKMFPTVTARKPASTKLRSRL
jgi:SAM-dependent methyltransferase